MTLRERLEALIKRKAEGIDAMSAMLNAADADGSRDLTPEEEANFAYLDAEVERIKKDETRTIKLINDEAAVNVPQDNIRVAPMARSKTPDEFRGFGEFLAATRFAPNDPRLNYAEMELTPEQREQSMGVGVEGGFAVPTQFLDTLLQLDPAAAIFRPRCTVIPAGSPPDSAITIPTLDQTAAQNIYGGVEVKWIAEGDSKPETDFKLKEVTLTPHEVAGYVTVTDKLLRNWTAAGPLIERQLRLAMTGTEDTVLLSGSGVGRPLGVLNSPALISIPRATANLIDYVDVYSMYARAKFGGSLMWIASQTVLPQLITMTDAGTNSVWLPGNMNTINAGAANAPPGTLFGIPLMFHERSPALGTHGDLILVDMSYYLIKDGSGPFVASSEHILFKSNKTVIKIFWNVDGQPWLTAPIPLEGSAANTVSPFVSLAA